MANWPEHDYVPRALLQALADGGVEFVVIGGVAVGLQALLRFTKDLDICYALDQKNLDRLGDVLVDLGAKLRGVPEEVVFVPDGRTLKRTQIPTLTTAKGDIDLLVHPDGAPEYEMLRRNATTMKLADREVQVASIDDLIAMKRAAGRPQDLVDIEALEIARAQG